jgi:integrase
MDDWESPEPGDANGEAARGTGKEQRENGEQVATELIPVGSREEWEEAADAEQAGAPRTWRQELPRWLATLDVDSTRREYEKAVRYFFETPGVPITLGELTYDLLLAYRGSLARRAERRVTRPVASSPAGTATAVGGGDGAPELLYGAGEETTSDEPGTGDTSGRPDSGARRTGPIAPATANLRITALRRFLLHCLAWGLLPGLTSDRVAAALRRLRIERRRPYQVLAEPEWEAFLAAARGPATAMSKAVAAAPMGETEPRSEGASLASEGIGRSPWGTPRAARLRRASETLASTDEPTKSGADGSRRVRSMAGLTGARTAVRDHALLALALATGLRAIELCALDVGDLHREWHSGREEWWLVLPDAKTKGQRGGRTLPLGAELARTLLDYVAATGRHWERAQDRATPLFLSGRRRSGDGTEGESSRAARLSTPQVRRIVDRVEAQWAAGEGGDGGSARQDTSGRAISPHALRHSTAVALLEGNEVTGRPPASVEHVRGWLGHFDIRTTQGYLAHVDSRRHRRPFALDPVQPSAGNTKVPGEDTGTNE